MCYPLYLNFSKEKCKIKAMVSLLIFFPLIYEVAGKVSISSKPYQHWLRTAEKFRAIKGFGGTILVNHSRTFVSLNHNLLIAKLRAYGFPRNGLKLFHSYFLSDSTETKLIYLYFMGEPIKGLPKWSVSGSICMLNMCLNDFTLPNLSMTQCFILMLMIL